MSDGLEKETIDRLTSAGNVLKNPFYLVDEVLTELGNLRASSQVKALPEKSSPVDAKKSKKKRPKRKKRAQPINRTVSRKKGSISRGLLGDLASMIQSCQNCGRGAFQDEIIEGICKSCAKQIALANADMDDELVDRLQTLEAQVLEMKSKNVNQGRISLKDIRREILTSIRKDLRFEIQTVAKGIAANNGPPLPVTSGIPPPPPPSPSSTENEGPNSVEIDFKKMDLTDLANFTPEILDSFALAQRNQFRDRLRELQQLERMSPEQREKYFEKIARDKAELDKVADLKDTLKNLEELANPLFMKMKEQAEGSILSGKGTLGKFNDVNVYLLCHKCANTNEVRDGEDQAVCVFCGTSLEMR